MSDSLDTICQHISLGRQLARQLAGALRGLAVNETEFRLLWLLSQQAAAGLEQRRLAEQLGVSPAQVSSVVEKLRSQQLIEPIINRADRRRQHWQLTPVGQHQLQLTVVEVESRIGHTDSEQTTGTGGRSSRKDAA